MFIAFSFLFQEGTVAVTKVANALLCMYSRPDVGLGLIKTKVSYYFFLSFLRLSYSLTPNGKGYNKEGLAFLLK